MPREEPQADLFTNIDVDTGDPPETEDYPDDELKAVEAARKEAGLPADAEAS
ncbi:hypothetical protein AB0M20_31450 [Actinoplanes sp. NPDC051633]|uniref:hypothetical protein n=1 Tax=Actinoplanes sp. NPDC051633 TaxID=3155670 RepID=UPI0034389888